MAVETVQDWGLDTLEGTRAPQSAVPYTDFWTETYPDAIRPILTPSVRTKVRRAGQFVNHVTDTVIRGVDGGNLGDYPDFFPTGSDSLGKVVAAWDASVGSLNGMHEGQGDLLRAAGLVLGHNVTDGRSNYTPISGVTPPTVYQAFRWLWQHNSLDQQYPGGKLLLAGQLIHKAAWLEPNSNHKTKLFHAAEAAYQRVVDAPTQWWMGKGQAAQYLADIKFHNVGEQLRQGPAGGRLPPAVAQVGGLMTERAAMLRKLESDHRLAVNKNNRGGAGFIAGRMFEEFVSLALRDSILTDWRYGKGGERFEVRHAFTSEDQSVSGVRPKPSFDLVVQRYDSRGGIATTPLQLKVGEKPHGDKSRGRGQYLPGIVYLRAVNWSPAQMATAAERIAEKYDPDSSDQGLPLELMQLQSRLGDLVLEPA